MARVCVCVWQWDHTVLSATHMWTIPAFTLCTYPRRDGQAELTRVTGHIPRQMSRIRNWIRTRSPIPVLTGPDIGQLRPTHYCFARPRHSCHLILQSSLFLTVSTMCHIHCSHASNVSVVFLDVMSFCGTYLLPIHGSTFTVINFSLMLSVYLLLLQLFCVVFWQQCFFPLLV